MENVFLFFHWYCIRVVCGKQTSCGWIFWTWPNTGENACVTFAWFASDFLPNWIRALMQQIELIFTCYCSCHHTNMMSFWNGKGSLLAFFSLFVCLDKCCWQRRAEQTGQKKWSAVKRPRPEAAMLLLSICWIPSPPSQSPFRVAHATFFMSSWAGVELQSPSLAVLKGSNWDVVKKISAYDFQFPRERLRSAHCLYFVMPLCIKKQSFYMGCFFNFFNSKHFSSLMNLTVYTTVLNSLLNVCLLSPCFSSLICSYPHRFLEGFSSEKKGNHLLLAELSKDCPVSHAGWKG